MDDAAEIIEAAQEVLENNRRGNYTIPADGLYPHQWLWDSCFISIGMRHYNVEQAQREILSLLRGQWHNGMLPHIIFASSDKYFRDQEIWRSWLNPQSPSHVSTSGITQPPMLAEAVYRVGMKLSSAERKSWYKRVYRELVAYHEWLYSERDPHDEGLSLQLHPWETGLDNTPPWMYELKEKELPFWVAIISSDFFKPLVKLIRRDVQFTPPGERLSNFEAVALYASQRRLKRKNYDIKKILNHSLFAIEDLTFNCILIRANTRLKDIAKTIGKPLPDHLHESMRKAEAALETLWSEQTGQYYSRNFATHDLIPVPSIAALMPLYAGCISQERAEKLVEMLHDKKLFGSKYQVPSVPLNSDWFMPHRYWQGPVWINTNWLITDGLQRYGFDKEAEAIKLQTIQLIKKNGFYEYFSPVDGSPAGTKNFSWSAALTIDLLS